jgi:vanillate O-demethylase monooxygenase subunit
LGGHELVGTGELAKRHRGHRTGRRSPRGVGVYGVHILAPDTDTTTHYHFVAVHWNPRFWGEPIDSEVGQQIGTLRRFAFEEQEGAIISAQQRAILDPPVDTSRPVMLEIDAGPHRFPSHSRQHDPGGG